MSNRISVDYLIEHIVWRLKILERSCKTKIEHHSSLVNMDREKGYGQALNDLLSWLKEGPDNEELKDCYPATYKLYKEKKEKEKEKEKEKDQTNAKEKR